MQNVHKLLESGKPIKWLFYGDSITHGCLFTFGARDYTEIFSERLRNEMVRVRDIVIKSGVSGDSTRDLLKDFEWRVAQFQPHVVFVMIGMNDCGAERQLPLGEFRENLKELHGKIAALPGCIPVFQTMCLILPKSSPDREPYFDAYMDVIREVAREEKIPLIDHSLHWKQTFEQNPNLHYYWMGDGFHPNAYGHMAFAELIFKKMGIHDPASWTGRMFYPRP